MPKKPTIEPTLDDRLKRWIIDVPATVSETGKRYKARFKTRDLARAHLAKIGATHTPSAAIPPRLAMEADKARSILEKWNLDLVEAAKQIDQALEAIGDAGTLVEAAKAFRASHEARIASCRMKEAVAAFMQTREDLRPSTFNSYRYTLERTFSSLHDENLADITHDQLQEILSEKSPTSRATHRRTLRVFWRWGVRDLSG